jgi:D-serine deaminase-like pyridoxal phosphate-dependent protein
VGGVPAQLTGGAGGACDAWYAPPAMTRAEIPTPALRLDLDRFERNVQKMAMQVRNAGKKLRPHSKTHKCPEIARRQVAAGAVGVCVAKVGEAEVMAAAGVRNLLITTEVVGAEKIGRLLRRQPETLVVVDHPDNVRELGEAMTRAGLVLNVLVDVDVGGRRTGTQPGEPALDLGRQVMAHPALNLRGLQGYAGQCAHVIGFEERRRTSKRWMGRLMKTRELFEKHALPADIVTGGSSGTFNIDVELDGLTELQAGSYCVMDLDYRRIGSPRGAAYDDFEMALTVLTTVVSVPSQEMAMVDGGFKAFSTDRPFVPEAVEWPGVEYSWAGDEHGRLTTTEPGRLPHLGQLIEFLPPHCDPTINLYDRIYAMRGETVEAVWEISGRGRSQ